MQVWERAARNILRTASRFSVAKGEIVATCQPTAKPEAGARKSCLAPRQDRQWVHGSVKRRGHHDDQPLARYDTNDDGDSDLKPRLPLRRRSCLAWPSRTTSPEATKQTKQPLESRQGSIRPFGNRVQLGKGIALIPSRCVQHRIVLCNATSLMASK